tara:strand:- start:3850 stop:4257 length:408 start_codon:yes stop_codon:yes gene_type:complete
MSQMTKKTTTDQYVPLERDPELTEVFVENIELPARIGVYAHEHGRTQPLVVTVRAWAKITPQKDALSETVNYRVFVDNAAELASTGHFDLVETFINQLADRLMAHTQIVALSIRASKPEAIENASHAGAAIFRRR